MNMFGNDALILYPTLSVLLKFKEKDTNKRSIHLHLNGNKQINVSLYLEPLKSAPFSLYTIYLL